MFAILFCTLSITIVYGDTEDFIETIVSNNKGNFIKDQVGIDLRDKDIVSGQVAVSNLCRAEAHAKNHDQTNEEDSTDCNEIDFKSNLTQRNLMFSETQKRYNMPFDLDTLIEVKKIDLYSLTFKKFSSIIASIISLVYELIKMKAEEQTTTKLAIFVIPNLKTLEDIEQVIKFECAHIINDYPTNKKYNEPSGIKNSMIRYIDLDLKKIENIREIIESIVEKCNSPLYIMHFFLISFSIVKKIEYFQFLYELYFYRHLEYINRTRLIVFTDLSYKNRDDELVEIQSEHNKHFGETSSGYDSSKFKIGEKKKLYYLIYQIFVKNLEFFDDYHIYHIQTIKNIIYNKAKQIELHIKDYEFMTGAKSDGTYGSVSVFRTHQINYFVRRECFITIFRIRFYCFSTKFYFSHLLYRIENKNKVQFIHYRQNNLKIDWINNLTQFTLYDHIKNDPYTITHKKLSNAKSRYLPHAFLEVNKDEPETFLYNLLTNIIDQPSNFCFELQNVYESYLFDTFAFKITAVKHFSYTLGANNTDSIKNLANSCKDALVKRFPRFNIEQYECNFVIGSRRYIKRLYTSIEVESKSNSKESKCNFKILNSQLSMLNFIRRHCIKFKIEESNTKQASYLYNFCKLFQFKIKDENCEDIFFMFFVEDSNVFYYFEKNFDILKRNDNKLKEFFEEIGEGLESSGKMLTYKYHLDKVEHKIEIDIFTVIEKNDLIFDLWNEFVKFTNFDLIYVLINKKLKEFVIKCFKNIKFEYSIKNNSEGEKSTKVSGTFEESVDKLTIIFTLFGEKMLANIYESYLKSKNNDVQVFFMSQNLFDYNFATYMNVYNNEVNKMHNVIINNCSNCCNNLIK